MARQFGTPAKKEDQSRIRRLADRDGSTSRQLADNSPKFANCISDSGRTQSQIADYLTTSTPNPGLLAENDSSYIASQTTAGML